MMGPPSLVSAECLAHGIGTVGCVHGGVVFKAMLTDHMHQCRKAGDLGDCARAEGVEGVVRELSLDDVGRDASGQVVGTDPT